MVDSESLPIERLVIDAQSFYLALEGEVMLKGIRYSGSKMNDYDLNEDEAVMYQTGRTNV